MGDEERTGSGTGSTAPTRGRGRATDGRPFVMVLAVAPWTAPTVPVVDPSSVPAAPIGPAV